MASEQVAKTRASLERVQNFETSVLPRVAQLGQDLSFTDAVEPASRIIHLFQQYPFEALDDLPDQHLAILAQNADAFFQQLTEIQSFDPKQQENPFAQRTAIVTNLRNLYNNIFNAIHSLISYGASRQRDFGALERDFRAAMQRSADEAADLQRRLTSIEDDAKRVLEEARKVAAEQGVSQQARYFQEESSSHEAEASTWRIATFCAAGALAAFAVASAFAHKWEWLQPMTPYEAAQLGISKILLFAILGYLVLLCARNFLSHKHNAIVNKHRQNALLTFNALVEAAGGEEQRDVILAYAASCIFSPQETGYTKQAAGSPDMPLSIIQAIPKLTGGGATH